MSTARGKRIGIGARPPANPHAEAWIRQGDADALAKGDLYTARLTLDVTPTLRARIKIAAFGQGVTVAELLRGLLEREFPEHRTENTP
ncbi:chromosome partitioning protein ParB [Stenotrophomonas maltophilia]|uniref:chromosome partitioning protein ParB n=1 Tax=Stenotrophomonas maltophilia TaxID=40324 RepID=UPI000C25C23E|nr:chromosome partitioning protein ParB [Stenotrophomonas maltophilia]PJL45022.1 chromosome partitioning protein ParB [Stenotrophomonas maltophilia]